MPQTTDTAQLQARIQAATELHEAGRLDEAEAAYRRLLADHPGNPDVLHILGVKAAQAGNPAVAADLIGNAIAVNPSIPVFHMNLGNVLRMMERMDDALASYERALELSPDTPDVLSNIGNMHQHRKRLAEAEDAYRRALAIRPDFVGALYNLGIVLRRLHRYEESAELLRRVLEIQPDFGPGYENLGRTLCRDRRFDEAAHVYAEWLRVAPDNPIARHMHASLTGRDVESRASDGYVRATFDRFASDFDQVLQSLDYRAPALVDGAAARWLEARDGAAAVDIIDAGCGTGLCGPLLRPRARRLVGVDLSSGMLAKAAERGVYDMLVEAELGAYFAEAAEPADLIVSADTLIYFGTVEPVLTGMAGTLRSGGAVIATFEALGGADGDPAFRLNAHGRYSHDRRYIARAVAAAGLALAGCEDVVLRNESGAPVAGLLVTAVKPGP